MVEVKTLPCMTFFPESYEWQSWEIMNLFYIYAAALSCIIQKDQDNGVASITTINYHI